MAAIDSIFFTIHGLTFAACYNSVSNIDHLSDGVEVQLCPEDRVALRRRVQFSWDPEHQLLKPVDGEVVADDVAQLALENHPLKQNTIQLFFRMFRAELRITLD